MTKTMVRVLLIEDDPMVQEVNKQFIEKVDGFKVIDKASNGKEGLEKVIKQKPDLVILDVYMPKQDGVEVLYELRKAKTGVDVIVVTAANDKETIKEMLQNGAIDYIMKPFKFDRIKQALERYKQYLSEIQSSSSFSQQQLDQFVFNQEANLRQTENIELPKGLNQATLEQIILFLKEQTEAKSAEDVAEGIGLARVTARRYLEYLKGTGHIELDIQYGGVGRPVNRYIMKQ